MTPQPLTRVLVVEDDPMVRRLLVRHFQKSNVAVVEAPDAEDAIGFFAQPGQRFDAVITDVHLPGMTGVDLAVRIRAHRPDQPIVFVTGDIDEDLARRALEGGSAGYLLKPFEFFELDAALAQAMHAPVSVPPPPVVAAVLSSFAMNEAQSIWIAEQRRLMTHAAGTPIQLQSFVNRRRMIAAAVYVKIAAVVLLLLGFAWYVGNGLGTKNPNDPVEAVHIAPAPEQKTVYVPYTPAAQQDTRRDRRR